MISNEYEYLLEDYDEDLLDEMDFLDGANNIYRTEEFIVKQQVSFCSSGGSHTVYLMSSDTYYYRTPERDAVYDMLFDYEGKRMHTAMYNRTYVY